MRRTPWILGLGIDPRIPPDPEGDEVYSNKVGRAGLPAYFVLPESLQKLPLPLPDARWAEGISPFTAVAGALGAQGGAGDVVETFLAGALGIAIASVPGALLSKKMGVVKGHAAGAAVSAAVLTALWLWRKSRGVESAPR